MSGTSLNDKFKNNILAILPKFIPQINYTEYVVDIAPGSAIGQGYVAAIFRVDVTKKNSNEVQNFIVKIADETKSIYDLQLVFGTEILFYEKVFPTFNEFQKRRGVKQPFSEIAKCVTTSITKEAELLVFENLKEQGFVTWNKKLSLPEDHVETVMKQYGKFHALSYALRDQHPETFNDLVDSVGDIMKVICQKNELKEMMELVLPQPGKILENFGYKDVADKYFKLIESVLYLHCVVPLVERDRAVIVHGDCWSGNMMFKYDENSKLADVRFLDWQIMRLSSPATDIAYFLFSTATGKVLEDLDKYLKIYYDSLSSFMRELGSDPEKVFTFPEFLEHFKKYCKSGFVSGLNIINFLYGDDSKLLDLADKDTLSNAKPDEKYTNECNERIKELLLFADRRGFL